MVLLLRVDHLFSFERLDSLSSLFFENRILHNMFFLLLLREETGFTKILSQGQFMRSKYKIETRHNYFKSRFNL